MFSFSSERLHFENSLILEEEEGFAIPDTERTEAIDDIQIVECEVCTRIQDTLDIEDSLREIVYIVHGGELFEEALFEFR